MNHTRLHRLRGMCLTSAFLSLLVLVAFGRITLAQGASCGDGLINEGSEECDGSDLGGATCVTLGFTGGALGCNLDCSFDASGCTSCGNGVVQAGEQCDDGNTTSGDGCNMFCALEDCSTDADCDDGDPCTIDGCDPITGMCSHTFSGDGETAKGPDGRCDSLDDNLDLFGPDRACGTGDDVVGDGVCSGIDNCQQAWNPTQVDSDADGAGDDCDPVACQSLTAYVTAVDRLVRVEVRSGNQQTVMAGGVDLTDVDVNAAETRAFVVDRSGRIAGIDLPGGAPFFLSQSVDQPWGIALGPDETSLYVTDDFAGEVLGIDIQTGGIVFSASGLSTPLGIALAPSGTAVYVAEYGSGELSEVDITGTPGGVTSRAVGLSGPMGVTLNKAGTTAYVTEATGGELSRVDLSTGVVTLVAGGLANPASVALDPSETTAYVVENAGQLIAIDLGTGGRTTIAPGFTLPLGLALVNRGPIVISLPEAATAAPGIDIVVPVAVSDVTGQGVLSADFTIEFNPGVLSVTGVTPGILAGGCTSSANLTVPGRAVVSLFCTSELVGSGSLVDIGVTTLGTEGQGSPLRFVQGMLNEGTPAVCLEDGAFVVPVQISGRISYYRDYVTSTEPSTKAVPGAVLSLYDYDYADPIPVVSTQTTSCTGDYSLPNLFPGHLELLRPGKLGDFDAAIDPFDASLNVAHVVGLLSLTPNQRLAADVTGNGALSSLDSARIAQFSVGLITQFPVAVLNGDWAFVPIPQPEPNLYFENPNPPMGSQGFIQYSSIIESAENQDFLGILFGDVSGNWQPSACPPLTGPVQPQSAGTVATTTTATLEGGALSLPTLTAQPGDIIRVPVMGTGVAAAVSFYLDVRYNDSILRLVQAQPGAAATGFSTTANLQEAARARLALFRATPMGVDGEVAVLTFEVIGPAGSRSWLKLPAYTVNEGKIAVSVNEGLVTVTRPTRKPR